MKAKNKKNLNDNSNLGKVRLIVLALFDKKKEGKIESLDC